MSERIVSPEDAQLLLDNAAWVAHMAETPLALAHTVATEPDRTRAAVVGALREAAALVPDARGYGVEWLLMRANVIENGAPFNA